MLYEELHQRYGTHVAKRVQVELSVSEFKQVDIEELSAYLDTRAEAAHKEYQIHHDNPFAKVERGTGHTERVDTLYRNWREAEDLAYLISIADDVGATTRRAIAGGK